MVDIIILQEKKDKMCPLFQIIDEFQRLMICPKYNSTRLISNEMCLELSQNSLASFYSTQKEARKFPVIQIALIFMKETRGLLLTGNTVTIDTICTSRGEHLRIEHSFGLDQYNILPC